MQVLNSNRLGPITRRVLIAPPASVPLIAALPQEIELPAAEAAEPAASHTAGAETAAA